MKFRFVDKRDDSVIEETEMSDCHTAEDAVNSRYGSSAQEWLHCEEVDEVAHG